MYEILISTAVALILAAMQPNVPIEVKHQALLVANTAINLALSEEGNHNVGMSEAEKKEEVKIEKEVEKEKVIIKPYFLPMDGDIRNDYVRPPVQ